MATTRRALEWDDLDLGSTVRLTTKFGKSYEGRYMGLSGKGGCVAELVNRGNTCYVPRETVVRKQLLKPAKQEHL